MKSKALFWRQTGPCYSLHIQAGSKQLRGGQQQAARQGGGEEEEGEDIDMSGLA